MIQICYFERVSDLELFERLLTQDGDIALERIDRNMPAPEVDQILEQIHGFQTRGGMHRVSPRFAIDRHFIGKCPKLLVVSTGGAGYDAINVADCTAAGILVVNQSGLNAEAVAEHALAMMLCLTKQIAHVNMAMRRDPDLDRFAFRNDDIYGKTLGIIGLGRIGTRVAEMCKTTFDMEVIAAHPRLTPEQTAERNARLVAFPKLLEQADFVLVSCGLNDETRGMFSAVEFKRMKPSAYFITVGRGGIHDEAALADALSAGELAGAGLDVWLQEPPPIDHPLLKFDNVLASPHTAAITHESARNASAGAAHQLRQIFRGEHPLRCVNPVVWPDFTKRYETILGRGHPSVGERSLF
jgi:D-3-phosphoglycerate dehydrogenase